MRIGPPLLIWACMVAQAAAAPPQRAWLIDAAAPQDALDAGQHQRMVERLNARVAALPVSTLAKGAAVVPLAWPLRPTEGFTPFGYTGTAYFVDHDPRFPGLVQDYTCGVRSYDLDTGYNHGGTDYYLWPYPWLMMDEGSVRVVAAAAGVIIEKHDGFFDRDCAIAGDGSAINAVYIAQDDGLVAWYLHMRKGSVTNVPVGTRIEAGEYLGVVGSSGPSSLPHLHFELTDAQDHVVDPRHGACNAAPDRWIVAQPYEAARILTLTTHSAEPEGVQCGIENGAPVHETPHAQDRFMPGDTVWAFAAYADQRNGEVTHFSLLRPDGSVHVQWDFDLASENLPKPFYSGTAWDWSHVLPADAPGGVWILRAEFAGHTYTHAFVVGSGVNPNQLGLGGSWANPATSGQGVVMEVEPDFYDTGMGLLFGGWFTFDPAGAGDTRWYTIQGQVRSDSDLTTLPIYLTEGGAFDSPLATTTTPVGNAIVQFGDCTHGTLQYAFTDGSARNGTIALTRLLPNVSCTQTGTAKAATNGDLLSGAWADPSNGGQGLVLDLNPLQHVLFAAWYTFAHDAGATSGAAGQRWYTLQATLPADPRDVADIGLYETRGGVFDGAATTTTTRVGTAHLVFHSCQSATLDYAFTSGGNAGHGGTLDLARIGATPAGCTL